MPPLEPEDKFNFLTEGSKAELRSEFEDIRRIAASWKLYLALKFAGDEYAEEIDAHYHQQEAA